jgi:hypothetical protein
LKLCNAHRQAYHKRTAVERNGTTSADTIVARIKGKVTITTAGCWLPPSSRSQPRGRMRIDGKDWLPYRAMATATLGDGKPGEVVGHLCESGDVGCCNPGHISWITQEQNMSHMTASGRGNPRGVRGKAEPRKSLSLSDLRNAALALRVDPQLAEKLWKQAA